MDDKNTFIHIISGEDYKLKSISYFNENFEDCDKIFCTVTECENLPKKIRERYTKGIFNTVKECYEPILNEFYYNLKAISEE